MRFIIYGPGFGNCIYVSRIEGCDYIAVDDSTWQLEDCRLFAYVDELLGERVKDNRKAPSVVF